MEDEGKCSRNNDFESIKSKITELEKDYTRLTYIIDSMNIKIDELKSMVKNLVDDLTDVHNYKYKVDNFYDMFVLKKDYYLLKSEVDRLYERLEESDRIVQRYQWWIMIIMGIITCISLIASFF